MPCACWLMQLLAVVDTKPSLIRVGKSVFFFLCVSYTATTYTSWQFGWTRFQLNFLYTGYGYPLRPNKNTPCSRNIQQELLRCLCPPCPRLPGCCCRSPASRAWQAHTPPLLLLVKSEYPSCVLIQGCSQAVRTLLFRNACPLANSSERAITVRGRWKTTDRSMSIVRGITMSCAARRLTRSSASRATNQQSTYFKKIKSISIIIH
jgi:hypothetical protein